MRLSNSLLQHREGAISRQLWRRRLRLMSRSGYGYLRREVVGELLTPLPGWMGPISNLLSSGLNPRRIASSSADFISRFGLSLSYKPIFKGRPFAIGGFSLYLQTREFPASRIMHLASRHGSHNSHVATRLCVEFLLSKDDR